MLEETDPNSESPYNTIVRENCQELFYLKKKQQRNDPYPAPAGKHLLGCWCSFCTEAWWLLWNKSWCQMFHWPWNGGKKRFFDLPYDNENDDRKKFVKLNTRIPRNTQNARLIKQAPLWLTQYGIVIIPYHAFSTHPRIPKLYLLFYCQTIISIFNSTYTIFIER